MAVLITYATAIGGAWLTGPGLTGLTGAVEHVSATSANLVESLAGMLPFGYAFAAGMVTVVNPCGFALLPTYLGLFLGAETGKKGHLARRAVRGLLVSAVVTSSFVLLFGLVGLVLSITTSTLARYLPWLGLTVGILMVLVGGAMISGRTLYTSVGGSIADRVGAVSPRTSARAYLLYGLAFGTASLSCTLPIFLTVVASALTLNGFLSGTFDFVLYGLGMGLVITVLTLSMAFFRHGVVTKARRLTKYLEPASTTLMLLGGAYIIYYWLTLGGLLSRFGR